MKRTGDGSNNNQQQHSCTVSITFRACNPPTLLHVPNIRQLTVNDISYKFLGFRLPFVVFQGDNEIYDLLLDSPFGAGGC